MKKQVILILSITQKHAQRKSMCQKDIENHELNQ
jgi:hypothetical protein